MRRIEHLSPNEAANLVARYMFLSAPPTRRAFLDQLRPILAVHEERPPLETWERCVRALAAVVRDEFGEDMSLAHVVRTWGPMSSDSDVEAVAEVVAYIVGMDLEEQEKA